jgi:uncharacterized protein
MEAVSLLQANDYPFHVISVLTREALGAADEMFDFFVEHGIGSVGFNVEETEGSHACSSLQSCPQADVAAFFRALMARVRAEPGKLAVREFVGARDAILLREVAEAGNPQAEALRFRSDRYGSFAFGNIHTGGLAAMLEDASFGRAEADVARGIDICRAECDYFQLCLGGAPANKLFERGSFAVGETAYCRHAKKAVIDVVLHELERGLANW